MARLSPEPPSNFFIWQAIVRGRPYSWGGLFYWRLMMVNWDIKVLLIINNIQFIVAYFLPPARLPASRPITKPRIKPSSTFLRRKPNTTPSTTSSQMLTSLRLFFICYLFWGRAIKLAISRYAPGTPTGNSLKNIIKLPLLSASLGSCMPIGAT